MAELQNRHNNQQLQAEGIKMQQRINSIIEKHLQKIQDTIHDQDKMKDHQAKTFESIDTFFEGLKKRVEARQEQLKNDYKQIEGREKRRLKNR